MADLKEIAAVAKAHGFGLEAINWRQSCYALRFIPALLFLFACLYSIPPYQDTGDDAAIYEGVADSLLHGDGYSLNGQPQVKFPPAFPVTLAALKFVTGSERIYPLAMAGCGAAALLILSVLLIRIEGPVFAFAATSMLAASPAFFSLVTGTTRSDVLFMLLSYLSLLLLLPVHPSQKRQRFIWLSILIPYTALVRSAGVALIAAACFDCRGRRLQRTPLEKAVPVLLAVLAMGAWMLWAHYNRTAPWPGAYMDSYTAQFMMKNPHRPGEGRAGAADLVERIASNAVVQSAHTIEGLTGLSWVAPLWYSPLFLALWAVSLCGLWASWKKADPVMAFTVFYLATILVWPFDEGQRFILPVIPFVLLYLWRGLNFVYMLIRKKRFTLSPSFYVTCSCFLLAAAVMAAAAGALNNGLQAKLSLVVLAAFAAAGIAAACTAGATGRVLRRINIPRSSAALLLLVLIANGLAGEVTLSLALASQKPSDGRHYPTVEAGRWLRNHTSAQAVIMAEQANILHRESGRRTAGFPVTEDASLIIKMLERAKAEYLLVIADRDFPYFLPTEEQRLRNVMQYRPSCFQLLHAGSKFWIYSFRLQAAECAG